MYEFLGKTEYIEHDDLEGMDLDWFALDDTGRIAHFATMGYGPVPKNLAKTDVRRLHTYFSKEREPVSEFLESQNWLEHAKIKRRDRKGRAKYLSSFAAMGRKGLYSYAGPWPWDAPCLYFRIAAPAAPLHVDELPQDVAAILKKTRIREVGFSRCCQILAEQLGDYVI